MSSILDHYIAGRRLRLPLLSYTGEGLFALFLFSGNLKADPRFDFIQVHIDITLLLFLLSFLVFIYRVVRIGFLNMIPQGFTRNAIFFILLAVCIVGGLLPAQSSQYGIEKAVKFVILTGWAFFGAMLLIADFRSLRRFSLFIFLISTAMAFDAYLDRPSLGQVSFVSAFGSNYIALARAAGYGLLASLCYLVPTEKKILKRFVLYITGMLLLWAVLSAGARGPVLALFLSTLFFFAASLRGFPSIKVERYALRLGFYMICVITALIPLAIKYDLFSVLANRTKVLVTTLGESAEIRLYLQKVAFNQWRSSPIWGAGTGALGMEAVGEDVRLYAHNIILELAGENGIIGVMIFLTMIGVAFRIGIRSFLRRIGIESITSRYLLVTCLFALINAAVSGDINDNRILFTYMALLMHISSFFADSHVLHIRKVRDL